MSCTPSLASVLPDPVLTDIAQACGTGGDFIYPMIAPTRMVMKDRFQYATWNFGERISCNDVTLRAPGSCANCVTAEDFSWTSGLTQEHALKDCLYDEVRNNAMNEAALVRAKIENIVHKLRMGIEIEVRDLITDTGTIASSVPAIKWDAANATIEADIDAAKEAFVLQCGLEPTHIVVPSQVARIMKRDAEIRDLIKYTQNDLLVNGDLPPTMFNLGVVIPGAIKNNAAAGAPNNIQRLYFEDKVVLLYVDPGASTNPEAITAVSTFQSEAFSGRQFASMTWRDMDPTCKTQWYAVATSYDVQLTAAGAAYILDDVLV